MSSASAPPAGDDSSVCLQEEEDLPVQVQPGSPEANENNPFLSSLQQSGISVTGLQHIAYHQITAQITVHVCVPSKGCVVILHAKHTMAKVTSVKPCCSLLSFPLGGPYQVLHA